jgi:hypothetical protein
LGTNKKKFDKINIDELIAQQSSEPSAEINKTLNEIASNIANAKEKKQKMTL